MESGVFQGFQEGISRDLPVLSEFPEPSLGFVLALVDAAGVVAECLSGSGWTLQQVLKVAADYQAAPGNKSLFRLLLGPRRLDARARHSKAGRM